MEFTEQLQVILKGELAKRFAKSLADAVECSAGSARISKAGHASWLIKLGLDAKEKLRKQESTNTAAPVGREREASND